MRRRRFELIAKTVREVSHADTAIIVLQSVGDTWAAEIVDGKNASSLLGITFPPEGRAMSVLHEGTGMIVDSMSRAQTMRVPQLAAFGSALYAPLRSRGVSSGVLHSAPSDRRTRVRQLRALARRITCFPGHARPRARVGSPRAGRGRSAGRARPHRTRPPRLCHPAAVCDRHGPGCGQAEGRRGPGRSRLPIESLIDSSLASIDEAVRQIRTHRAQPARARQGGRPGRRESAVNLR